MNSKARNRSSSLLARAFAMLIAGQMILQGLPGGMALAQSAPAPKTAAKGQAAQKDDTAPVPATQLDALQEIQESLSSSSDSLTLQFENAYYKKSIRRKADFTKTLTRGTAYFSKPSFFRWQIADRSSELVFDGKNFYQFYPKTKSATEMQKASEFLNITEIFLNFDRLRQSYEVTEFKSDDLTAHLSLKPIKNQDIEKALVTVDRAGKFIKRLELHYPGGERSEITFSSPDRSTIEASKFQLPGGTQISKL